MHAHTYTHTEQSLAEGDFMLKTKDSGVGGNVFGGKFDHRVSKVLITCIFLDSAILSRGI